VWQSGVVPAESTAKAFWVFGAGPFQRGRIYGGTTFAGDKFNIPLVNLDDPEGGAGSVSVADEAYFTEPKHDLAQEPQPAAASGIGEASEAATGGDAPGTGPTVVPAGLTRPEVPEASGQPPPPSAFPSPFGAFPASPPTAAPPAG
jgi:hypothetical protein